MLSLIQYDLRYVNFLYFEQQCRKIILRIFPGLAKYKSKSHLLQDQQYQASTMAINFRLSTLYIEHLVKTPTF
jgi:hypothetical protein